MTISPDLLEILVCPENHLPLRLAEPTLIGKINSLIQDGKLKNRLGLIVSESLDSALIRSDNKIAYPIREDIPVLLIDEAILLDSI